MEATSRILIMPPSLVMLCNSAVFATGLVTPINVAPVLLVIVMSTDAASCLGAVARVHAPLISMSPAKHEKLNTIAVIAQQILLTFIMITSIRKKLTEYTRALPKIKNQSAASCR